MKYEDRDFLRNDQDFVLKKIDAVINFLNENKENRIYGVWNTKKDKRIDYILSYAYLPDINDLIKKCFVLLQNLQFKFSKDDGITYLNKKEENKYYTGDNETRIFAMLYM